MSIKRASPEPLPALIASGKWRFRIDDARVEVGSISLSELVQMAYGLPDDQISGPGWLAEERFAIAAKLTAGASKSPVPEMLQAMLAERFQMTVHHEEKVRPVYLLVVGKAALKLQESAGGDPDRQGCNGGRGGHHVCQNMTMEELARELSQGRKMSAMLPVGTESVWLDRPVLDRTGLKGAYDFSMDYGRVGSAGGRRGGEAPANDLVTVVPIADAVKALGLALEPGRQPFDILAIDHIERVPTGN